MRKRIFALLLPLMTLFMFTACSDNGQASNGSCSNNASQQSSSTEKTDNSDISDTVNSETDIPNDSSDSDTNTGSKILVAFFSHADENYGVGYIEKGNTHIIADMIAEEVGADSFEIVRVTPYPEEYKACTDEAKAEQNANARPELTAAVDNFGDDVLLKIYDLFEHEVSYKLSRQAIKDTVPGYLRDEHIELEDEYKTTDNYASAILRKLADSRWIEEETDSTTYERQITMTDNGIALAEFLQRLIKPPKEEYSSYIYVIYNTLKNREQWENW